MIKAKYRALIIVSVLPLFLRANGQGIIRDSRVEKVWQTQKEFQIPESACYDGARQVLYVSNINGKSSDKDGNGFLSKVSMEGKILSLKWVEGLNAPKGMGIYGNVLYVADIDRVATIDIVTGKILQFYEADQAEFLNDIAIDEQGNVYISDTMGNKIYRLKNGHMEVWLDDPALTRPNGLFSEEKDLLIGCQKIVRADYINGRIKIWMTGTGSIDGLEGTGNGRYIFSDWTGHVFLIGHDESITTVLDLTTEGMNAADIEYIPADHLLLVPTFNGNRVLAFRLLK